MPETGTTQARTPRKTATMIATQNSTQNPSTRQDDTHEKVKRFANTTFYKCLLPKKKRLAIVSIMGRSFPTKTDKGLRYVDFRQKPWHHVPRWQAYAYYGQRWPTRGKWTL